MTSKTTINASELPAFDMVDYLKTDEDIAQYLSVVVEDECPRLLPLAMIRRLCTGFGLPADLLRPGYELRRSA